MARLFTTKPDPADIEIHLDAPETENIETDNKDENINCKTVNNSMTISVTTKNKKKLTGTWLKLLSLPPQELVSELKVIKKISKSSPFIFISF